MEIFPDDPLFGLQVTALDQDCPVLKLLAKYAYQAFEL